MQLADSGRIRKTGQNPSIEHLLQASNCARVPQNNFTLEQPRDSLTGAPKEFLLIDFGNNDVNNATEPLDIMTDDPATPLQQVLATQSEGATISISACISS